MAEGRRFTRTARTLPPDAAAALVDDFQRLLQLQFREHGGRTCVDEGDTVAATFPSLRQALAAAVAARNAVARHDWPHGLDISISVGIAETLEACALICDIAEGGEIYLSATAAALLEDDDLGKLSIRDLGERPARRTDDRAHVYELISPRP